MPSARLYRLKADTVIHVVIRTNRFSWDSTRVHGQNFFKINRKNEIYYKWLKPLKLPESDKNR